jgi:hypothetical protein
MWIANDWLDLGMWKFVMEYVINVTKYYITKYRLYVNIYKHYGSYDTTMMCGVYAVTVVV